MAEVTTIQVADRHVPQKDSGEVFCISMDFTLAADLANNADTVTLFEFQRAGTVVGGYFSVAGTLGAGATVQLRAGGTAITGATTAGGADAELVTAMKRVAIGDKIDLLVGGADFSAATTMQLNLLVCHNPVIDAAQLTA